MQATAFNIEDILHTLNLLGVLKYSQGAHILHVEPALVERKCRVQPGGSIFIVVVVVAAAVVVVVVVVSSLLSRRSRCSIRACVCAFVMVCGGVFPCCCRPEEAGPLQAALVPHPRVHEEGPLLLRRSAGCGLRVIIILMEGHEQSGATRARAGIYLSQCEIEL